jgi:putative redox protein
MSINATVKWIDDLCFLGESSSGHGLVIDGNKKLGASPMELILLGVAGCASIDVVMILEKGRHAVTDCKAEIQGQRAEEAPKIFTSMHLHFVVTGHNLAEEAVARAVNLSAEKYCSAALTLKKSLPITYDFEIQAA